MERRYDDYDYMADTWDTMTDGMYGDMPEGFDGDFDFLGWRRIDVYSPLCVRDWSGILCGAQRSKDRAESPTRSGTP